MKPLQSPGKMKAPSGLPTFKSANIFITLSVAAMRRNDFRDFGTRFHDLRHFFASQLIGHLFPGRGKEASARYEKSMADAKVRHKAETRVSNPLAIDGEEGPEGTVTN